MRGLKSTLTLAAAVCVLAVPTAAIADTSQSVNEYPDGLWTSQTAAAAHSSTAVAPNATASDGYGCASGEACGWVVENFGAPMGQWAQSNNDFRVFSQSDCNGNNAAPDANGTWNDCVSSIDDNKGCTFTWWVNIDQSSDPWIEQPGVAHSDLGSSNNAFSSDTAGC